VRGLDVLDLRSHLDVGSLFNTKSKMPGPAARRSSRSFPLPRELCLDHNINPVNRGRQEVAD
jgi:hypothetical protein